MWFFQLNIAASEHLSVIHFLNYGSSYKLDPINKSVAFVENEKSLLIHCLVYL